MVDNAANITLDDADITLESANLTMGISNLTLGSNSSAPEAGNLVVTNCHGIAVGNLEANTTENAANIAVDEDNSLESANLTLGSNSSQPEASNLVDVGKLAENITVALSNVTLDAAELMSNETGKLEANLVYWTAMRIL